MMFLSGLMLCFLLSKYPGVGWPGRLVILCLTFWGTAKLFYSPTGSALWMTRCSLAGGSLNSQPMWAPRTTPPAPFGVLALASGGSLPCVHDEQISKGLSWRDSALQTPGTSAFADSQLHLLELGEHCARLDSRLLLCGLEALSRQHTGAGLGLALSAYLFQDSLSCTAWVQCLQMPFHWFCPGFLVVSSSRLNPVPVPA